MWVNVPLIIKRIVLNDYFHRVWNKLFLGGDIIIGECGLWFALLQEQQEKQQQQQWWQQEEHQQQQEQQQKQEQDILGVAKVMDLFGYSTQECKVAWAIKGRQPKILRLDGRHGSNTDSSECVEEVGEQANHIRKRFPYIEAFTLASSYGSFSSEHNTQEIRGE